MADSYTIQQAGLATDAGELTFLSVTVHGKDVHAALGEALAQCVRRVGDPRRVVRQAFFAAERAESAAVADVLRRIYGSEVPPTSYVRQPPAGGEQLALELWAFGGDHVRTDHGVTLATGPGGVNWAFLGGFESHPEETPECGTRRVLSEADTRLAAIGAGFGRVVRTWFYIGNILATDAGDLRYTGFNRARNRFYDAVAWPAAGHVPASTGIGMHGRTTVFEAIALLPANGKCRLAFMQNPLQCPPSEYGEARVRNPRFSRAAGVLAGNAGLLFVSGTASVRGRRIAGGNDAVAQTRATLENMAALMAAELLVERHGWPRPVTWADFRQIRVYVKTGAMLAAVKRCCQETFPGVPQLYLQADVCLPDALVEIEGVAAIRGS